MRWVGGAIAERQDADRGHRRRGAHDATANLRRQNPEENAMFNRDMQREISDAGESAGARVRDYADSAAGGARSMLQRGRSLGERLTKRDYRRQLTTAAEDLADTANYQYRRARRQVTRHPVAAVAIVAGTITAFLLLRRAFRSDDE
jgi:hypothetical protein